MPYIEGERNLAHDLATKRLITFEFLDCPYDTAESTFAYVESGEVAMIQCDHAIGILSPFVG